MIRLLIVDDQKYLQQQIILLLAQAETIKIVATAENGQIAIEKVEHFRPNVVLMDFSMPVMDGITATQIMSQRYPDLKILMLTGSNDNNSLNQALIAGAKGYLLKGLPKEDLIAAIHAVHRGSIYIGPKVWQHSLTSLLSSSESKPRLERWTMGLAKEVIVWWRTRSTKEPIFAKEILAQLELNDNPEQNRIFQLLEHPPQEESLFAQLKWQIEQLQENFQKQPHQSLSQKLQQGAQKIGDLSNIRYMSLVQSNAHNFRIQKIEQFQKSLTSLWQTTAPQPLLNCLQNLESSLVELNQQYQKKQEEHIQKENSAWRAYVYLKLKLENDRPGQKDNFNQDWQSAWNALYYIYEDAISAEIARLASQLIVELLQQTRVYLDHLQRTEALLEELQRWFEQKSNVSSFPSPFLVAHLPEPVDPFQLCAQVESWTGHSLNQWGVSHSISAETIREALLVQLRPLALSTYTESYLEAIAISEQEKDSIDNYELDSNK